MNHNLTWSWTANFLHVQVYLFAENFIPFTGLWSATRHSWVCQRIGWVWHECNLHQHYWELWLHVQHWVHWKWILMHWWAVSIGLKNA